MEQNTYSKYQCSDNQPEIYYSYFYLGNLLEVVPNLDSHLEVVPILGNLLEVVPILDSLLEGVPNLDSPQPDEELNLKEQNKQWFLSKQICSAVLVIHETVSTLFFCKYSH